MDHPNDAQPTPEKKIIVDEDWKAQVQAEKEKDAPEGSSAAPTAAQAEKHPCRPPR